MNPEQWAEVDRYFNRHQIADDATLDAALEASAAAELPTIAVSAAQGKLLQLFARMVGARRILEIGTLGGYSTLWLARALPQGGRLVTLELESKHAEVARANFARAGVGGLIEVRVGPAAHGLARLAAEKCAPFDLVFIDADKASIPEYFEGALRLSHVGTAIVVDNVVRQGAVVDAMSADEGVRGVRRFMEALANEKRVSATTIQTVGAKGYDGFTLALVNAI